MLISIALLFSTCLSAPMFPKNQLNVPQIPSESADQNIFTESQLTTNGIVSTQPSRSHPTSIGRHIETSVLDIKRCAMLRSDELSKDEGEERPSFAALCCSILVCCPCIAGMVVKHTCCPSESTSKLQWSTQMVQNPMNEQKI